MAAFSYSYALRRSLSYLLHSPRHTANLLHCLTGHITEDSYSTFIEMAMPTKIDHGKVGNGYDTKIDHGIVGKGHHTK